MSRVLIAAVCSMAALLAQPNTLTQEEKSAGWTLLFDGHSYAGWRDPALMDPRGDGWKIEDGALETRPNPHNKDDLISLDLYKNFELTFEFRVGSGANGGIKYLIQRWFCMASDSSLPFGPRTPSRQTQRSDIRPGEKMACNELGLEYQILDDDRHSDGRTPNKRTASVYGLIAPVDAHSNPVGEWNNGRILVRGSHVEHWLNGVKVAEADLDSDEIAAHLRSGGKAGGYWLRQCPIALQHHNEPLSYRSLKLRRLPD
ncbi:MAG TPA: DUF1080 domain-containing protein [Bryobacteraceae bacterium]|jgi:hypothetical protein